MARQPKKTNSRTSTAKKTSTKSTRRRSKKTATFKKSLFIVLGVFLMISMVAFGYFLGQHDMLNGHTPVAQTYKTHETESKKKLLEDLSKLETQKPQEKKEVKRPVKSSSKEIIDQNEKIMQEALYELGSKKRVKLADRGGKPKLVIILDDVSTKRQLNAIRSTGLKLTPAIFPPFQNSKRSNKLAQGLEHYMVHLPMESGSAQFNSQTKTILTSFSNEEIINRVKEIRELFPTARFLNNHTGSVYTDNYDAMKRLYSVIRSEGFVFVDSRTIASTKVPRIAEEFGDAYVARDVFIDNEHNVPYIHDQLRKAVKKAKKKGYAIAIGHPHKMTLKAITTAVDIFSDVELVYIDELYQ